MLTSTSPGKYYTYPFISPKRIYALIKEELKSYFDSGAVDDLLFSLYTSKCLDKLGRGSYDIYPALVSIDNYEGRLPVDFKFVREAWLCTSVYSERQLAPAQYAQIMTRIDKSDVRCDVCDECESPGIIKAIYKTNDVVIDQFQRQYLLKPGNVNVIKNFCSQGECANVGVTCADEFDIRDGKLITNFQCGTVNLIYYGEEYSDEGYPLIPDNYRIKEYIEAYIKYKMFEMLCNLITDETYNQIEQKKQYYEQRANEAYIIADVETKKETIYQQIASMRRTKNRLNKYRII